MKFKRSFLILFFLLLIFNCQSVSAKLFCEYKNNNGRNIKITVDDGKIDIYNNYGNATAYLQFELNDGDNCPNKIYTSGQNQIYVFNIKPEKPSGVSDSAYDNIYDELTIVSQTTNNKVSCGSGEGMITGIPGKIPELTSFAFTLVQVAVPVILVLLGSLDLFKGMTTQKEDEIKKGQQMFIKRLAIAAIIFFVVIIVKFLISIVSDTNVSNIVSCIDCFISNDCG